MRACRSGRARGRAHDHVRPLAGCTLGRPQIQECDQEQHVRRIPRPCCGSDASEGGVLAGWVGGGCVASGS
jgi:hypothetical protein